MSRKAMSLLRDGRGLSLTELVVTLALFALVMVGVVGTWGKAQEAYFIGSESAEVQQNVRAAIDFMVREIRSARPGRHRLRVRLCDVLDRGL